jgi:succinate-acetate transporter protein
MTDVDTTVRRTAAFDTASPWILGLFGLAGATFIVAARMAHWYGGPQSDLFLFPFATLLGGLATFLAGMWAYRAEDGLATAMLGTWGAFWLAYGLLTLLVAGGRLTVPTGAFRELGFWLIALAAISWAGTAAAVARSTGLVAVFGFLAAGATIAAIADLVGSGGLNILAGWLLIIGAVCAWYMGTAAMLEEAFGREILPIGETETSVEASGREAAPLRPQIPSARRAG